MTDQKIGSIHRNYAQERVYFGRPFLEALDHELKLTQATKAYVVTSKSLIGEGAVAHSVAASLGDRHVGVYAHCEPHSPRRCSVEVAIRARAAKADVIVAVGGGSVIDTCKLAQLCLMRGIDSVDQLDAHRRSPDLDASFATGSSDCVRIIAIPTTLSGAEFTFFAGIKNEKLVTKESFADSRMIPRAVILDSEVASSTPQAVLLSSGMKCVDHAVEAFLSIHSHPLSDALTLHSLQMLEVGLRKVKTRRADSAAIHQCQMGLWAAMSGSMGFGVGGISHTLGAVLGGWANVPHGETSCVTLPATLKWRSRRKDARLRQLSSGFSASSDDPGEMLDLLVHDLGMPMSLRDVGLSSDNLDGLADRVMLNRPPFQHHFYQPMTRSDVMEILQIAF